MRIFWFVFFISFLALGSQSWAQEAEDKVKIKTGGFAPKHTKWFYMAFGGNAYRGDLNSAYQQWMPGFRLGYQNNKQRTFNGSLNVCYRQIKADDLTAYLQQQRNNTTAPNTFVKTNIIALDYQFLINFINQKNLIIYGGIGAGIMRFSSTDRFNQALGPKTETRAEGEDFSNLSIYWPASIGFLFRLSPGVATGLRLTAQNPVTDYLDNISELGTRNVSDNILSIETCFYFSLTQIKTWAVAPKTIFVPSSPRRKFYFTNPNK